MFLMPSMLLSDLHWVTDRLYNPYKGFVLCRCECISNWLHDPAVFDLEGNKNIGIKSLLHRVSVSLCVKIWPSVACAQLVVHRPPFRLRCCQRSAWTHLGLSQPFWMSDRHTHTSNVGTLYMWACQWLSVGTLHVQFVEFLFPPGKFCTVHI